ncbi:MAG: sulfatase [Alistipes sp.]
MKRKEILGLSLALPLAACNTQTQRPNIVFFLVDDMGWVDSSVAYGEEVYPNNTRFNTPNMQALAESGVIMTNAYACPVSTPTRTSLLTGMNAAHMGITNWTSTMRDKPSDASGGAVAAMTGTWIDDDKAIERPDWNINGVSPVEGIAHTAYATPLPKLLRDAGYFTIHVGKAHWASAGTPGASPYNMGFTVNVSGNVAGMPCSYLSEDHYGNTPEKWNYLAVQNMTEYYDTGIHLTEALTREALKTLEYPIAHKEPFYLYMAHYATHTPIQPDDRFVQKYRDAGMDEGQARYASMVEGVDKSLGDIVAYLKEKGVYDNTVIIFMTDNGGNSENKQKGGVPHTHNKPLREGKGSCYEGGIRVPLAFYWKGHITPATRINTPVIAEDLFPTILEIAGAQNQKYVQQTDGQSLVRLITDGSKIVADAAKNGDITTQKEVNAYIIDEAVSGISPERAIVLHYPHKWKPYDLADIDYLSAVRKGDWKLVYRMRTRELELYNLRNDIGEQTNLAAENPEKTAELATELGNRLREWNAPMPKSRITGKPVPMPDKI